MLLLNDNGDGSPNAGGGNLQDEGNNNDAPSSSYQKLKTENEDLKTKLEATTNQLTADRRKLEDRIKELESNQAPPDSEQRIANLEIQLARSQAVSKFGLSEEDAALLKGSPEQIMKDAEYWSDRLKEKDQKGNDNNNQSNRDMIDQKVNGDQDGRNDGGDNQNYNGNNRKPKNQELSWMERYKAATPGERAKMDKDVQDGLVDPRPSKNK